MEKDSSEKIEFIEIDELIKTLKEKNISIGKGDPYNTLRYYTKIGWLPNMQRRKNAKGEVTGHYTTEVIDRINLINKYKDQGLSNEIIKQKLDSTYKWNSFRNIVVSKEFQDKAYKLGTVLILILLVVFEINAKPYIQATPTTNSLIILESGTFFIPKNRSEITVKANSTTLNNKIYISFKNNYSPALRYWYEETQDHNGFVVKLDAPVVEDTYFDWWISK